MILRLVSVVLLLAIGMASPGHGQSSDPASPQPMAWRALAVAGVNSASVFDNAVAEIATLLAARGAGPINRLTSDPMLTRAGLPIATAPSIIETLLGVRPDPHVGCLVFITSHGGRNGVLLRDDPNNEFVLQPAALGRILDRGCGSAPTVAIISACFSGVFVDRAIEAPNRIILTAARNDRPSFGCGHEEQFTYFDGCMFQAWPKAETWRALYAAIQNCVRKKEDALGFEHSEPQAYFGAAVANLRLP